MKDNYIRFRVSSSEKQAIFDRAASLGMSVSDYFTKLFWYDSLSSAMEREVLHTLPSFIESYIESGFC